MWLTPNAPVKLRKRDPSSKMLRHSIPSHVAFTMFDQTGKTLHFIKKSKLLPGDFQIARGSLRLPPHREEVLSSGLLHYQGPWNDSIAPGASSVVWVRPADHTAVEAQCHKRTRQSLSTDKPGLDSTDVLPVSVTNSRTATGQQSIAEVANINNVISSV